MGGAMDLTVGAKKVIAATCIFDKGQSKLVKRCSLPLSAKGESTMYPQILVYLQ
jgi:acetate CoA/acetoacetate CoA-transferase beta subunit